ncbi:MAG: hypothetical protein DRK00_08650, partial [Thermoprotei archaeon]
MAVGEKMRLLEVRIRLLSPAIITAKRVERGYVKPLNYVPGSMLRGAILSALYWEGRISENVIEREAERPGLLASPAYPLIEGVKSLPATPFAAECKYCGAIIEKTRESVDRLRRGEEPEPPTTCPKCEKVAPELGPTLRTIYGTPLARIGGALKRVGVRSFRATSVGINKRSGAAMRGMLYDYEAIAEGSEFWARLVVPDYIELGGRLEITLGRGGSRGFGAAVLEVVGEHEPRGEVPSLSMLYAVSPIIPLRALPLP